MPQSRRSSEAMERLGVPGALDGIGDVAMEAAALLELVEMGFVGAAPGLPLSSADHVVVALDMKWVRLFWSDAEGRPAVASERLT